LVIAKGPGIGVLLQGWHFNAFLLDFGNDRGMTLLRGGLQGLHAPALIDNKRVMAFLVGAMGCAWSWLLLLFVMAILD